MSVPLDVAIEQALRSRVQLGGLIRDLRAECIPLPAPDLFSNDYLSLSSDAQLRQTILDTLSKCPSILGAGGSRLLGGNSPMHVQFEERMKDLFGAPAALLCNSGFDANVALLGCVPQKGDVIVFDELVHASARDGIEAARVKDAKYSFTHNDLASLKAVLQSVLQRHRNISERNGTVFIVVESLYSMDGDFAPLPEIVSLVEELIPENCYHIVVDEAHSTGIYGKGGRGVVAMLGLDKRVQTVVHTFGKARGAYGAILLTTPLIVKFLVNFGRPVLFSTALPYMNVVALNAIFDYIEGPVGQSRIERLQHLCIYFETRLTQALKEVPRGLLTFTPNEVPKGYPKNIRSPIFPVVTPLAIDLANHLRSFGYGSNPIHSPAVPRDQERIRIIVHAANKESELEDLIKILLAWANTAQYRQVGARSTSLKASKL